LSAPIPEWWIRARFREDEVWAGLDWPGSPLADVGGLVPYRYRGSAGERVYRTRPGRIVVIGTSAVQLPPAFWADSSSKRTSASSPDAAREGRADRSERAEELARELAAARRRIAELENELRRERARRVQRAVTQPPAMPADLDDLIQLCHPDRHPEARQALANKVTAALLSARKAR
jgi:hypothetical protein